MIAIFKTEIEAIDYSNKIHEFLLTNRPRYNAIKWGDPVKSADGLEWWVKVPYDYQNWTEQLTTSEADSLTTPLPEFGIEVVIGKHYLYKGGIVKCRQTHNRTIYDPKDTPALFSFFRDNSDSLEWIVGEQVEVGWMRIYEDVKYEVIQAHQTQSDWSPNIATTLWKVYVDPTTIPDVAVWIQPLSTNPYMLGNKVTYNGFTWESTINNNVWAPGVYGWIKI